MMIIAGYYYNRLTINCLSNSSFYMGIQFPPIAFLYLLYFYICIYIFILYICKKNY